MSEIGEAVGVALADELTTECPFSHDEGPHDKKNDLKNNSHKLGSSLAGDGDPEPDVEVTYTFLGKKKTVKVICGAHHLIPGNASLAKSQKLLKLMKKGELKGDIGYGVNHANNGVWLPGNYAWNAQSALRWGRLSAEGGLEIQYAYAYAAMSKMRRQFHDAHPVYSGEVRAILEKIRLKLLDVKAGCEKCQEVNGKKPYNPPYGLVGILDGVSAHLLGMVTGSSVLWKTFYTSEMSILYSQGLRPETMLSQLGG
jgi:hypothetical protein